MPTRQLAPLLLVSVALALAGCGGDGDETEGGTATGPSVRTVEIDESDFKLSPSSLSIATPGVYAIRAVNRGQTTHALEIEGNGIDVETNDIAPGQSAEVKVELKAGEYELYCPVDSHREMGMEGSIRVAGAAGTDTSSGASSTGSDGYGP
jgi:plastocyanin